MATLERNVLGLFDTRAHAEQAIQGLQNQGFSSDAIGVAVQSAEQASEMGGGTTAAGE